MNRKIKILISYHKRDILFKDDILTPIHVGRNLALKTRYSDNEKLKWMLDNMIGDNTGDNISTKNASYNEMTGIYWAWKNYEELGNPDFIGFMHYRRHFVFKDTNEVYLECSDRSGNYLETLNYSPEYLQDTLSKYDFICTKPYFRDSVYEYYKSSHKIEDLELALKILKERHPEYASSADKYIKGNKAYYCNMFILPRDLFFKYAEWIFDILAEFEKRTDITNKRFFISERLTGIFINHLLENGYSGKFFATMFLEEQTRIPVVFATSEDYAMPTCVAMTSILINAQATTFYDFYLLIPPDFSERSMELIDSLTSTYTNCDINFIGMKDKFSNVQIKISHITYVTYYRLLLAEILPQYNKCIYLDSDVIVNQDLTSLFRINIDDFYVAGVKAPGYHYPEDGNIAHCKEVGLPSIDQYINAGVLLLNLKRIREDGLTGKFLEFSDKGFSSLDQDVINLVCYNNIKHLPFKFNVMIPKYINKMHEVYKVFSKQEIQEANDNAVIIHYCDRIKPWQRLSCYHGEYWWRYAKKSQAYNDILSRYGHTILSDVFDILKLKKDPNKILSDINVLKNEVDNALAIIEKKRKHHNQNSSSFSWRNAIVCFPRGIRKFLKCWKEYGLRYTLNATSHEIKRLLTIVKGTKLAR